ncbi:MAG TPA: four helix bundle protein [Candidatus Paceibacterota bacterium]|nr:four helix bundle protein [Candidatus Paceibacterota bacterium]
MPPPPASPSVLQKAKAAYTSWFAIVENIPKSHRYTLGGKVEQYFLELLECIFTALYLSPEKKTGRLESAISKLDGVKFFAQLCWENKCMSNKAYADLSEKLLELGKMIGGWKKGLESKLSEKKTPAQKLF